ncbi:MAG: tail fiber domain-containing protein [Pseudomonadota bacterium]
MTTQTRDYLAKEFKDGERPSGQDFADLIESFVNKTDDGMSFDSDKNLLLSRGVVLGDSAGASAGTVRFRGGKVQFHNGTTWVDLASGDSGAFQKVGAAGHVAYAGGNVGIGAFTALAPPLFRLDVDLGINAGEGDRARFGNAVCSNGPVGNESSAQFSHRKFQADNNYALRQDTGGNVFLNTPTSHTISLLQNGSNPRLTVTTNGNVVVGAGNNLIGAGAAIFQVAGAAYKNNGQSTWDITSDARVKADVRDLDKGLNDLLRVRPVRFRYNGKAGTTAGIEGVGIVGQEIEKIFPDMVRHVENPDPANLGDGDLLIYNASAMTYILINAVKELAGQVQGLERELTRLQTEHASGE